MYSQWLLEVPVMRAAYSNRTSWLMSRLSAAAYVRFDSVENQVAAAAEKIAAAGGAKDKIQGELNKFKDVVRDLATEGRGELQRRLAELGFELIEVFDAAGTQAYLACRSDKKMAVLAFRGTEKNPQDIKTDFDATLIEVRGARAHQGFYQAYKAVEPAILRALAPLGKMSLYITGHSLGGALAIVAACEINADHVAACYTFGSPKVGNYAYAHNVNVPIYRVVNSADMVPGVPPVFFLTDMFILLARSLARFIPVWGKVAVFFLQNIKGYVNYGDLRYLMDCDDPQYADIVVLSNPDPVTVFGNWLSRMRKNLKAPVDDHSIDIYSGKLECYATGGPAKKH